MTEMGLSMCALASIACWFQEHAVSMASGMKTCVAVRSAYLAVFQFAGLPHCWRLTLPGWKWRLCVSLHRCLEWFHPMPWVFLWTMRRTSLWRLLLSFVVTPRDFCGRNLSCCNRSPGDVIDLLSIRWFKSLFFVMCVHYRQNRIHRVQWF